MTAGFDAIVVGAGPAGVSAAYALARAGLQVVVFERGEYPGAKNMFGGVLYGSVLHDLVPEFWQRAPVERRVANRTLSLLSERSSVSLDVRSDVPEAPNAGFTVVRPRFDQWFAQEAIAAGAVLVPETVVDSLLHENGRVVGVVARRDQGAIRANVVILADGVNSLLAKQAGLRRELQPKDVGLGVRELISLPRETIEARFNLSTEQGAAREYVGTFSSGVQAGGFIYTNRESLSVGVVANLASLQRHGVQISKLLDNFKAHPSISGLLAGGSAREYAAHLVPESGIAMLPHLCDDGVLVVGDAAGLVCATGISLEGVNYAIASGIAAAEAVKLAKASGDYSRHTLAAYERLLRHGFVLRDLALHRRAPSLLTNARLYQQYPEAAAGFFERLFSVNGRPKRRVLQIARAALRGKATPGRAMLDCLSFLRWL